MVLGRMGNQGFIGLEGAPLEWDTSTVVKPQTQPLVCYKHLRLQTSIRFGLTM